MIDTFPKWLDEHPHTIVALAIFDMDLYRPTKVVLERLLPRLVKGSILVFDELTLDTHPGEARAVFDVLGLNKLALRRDPNQSYCAWCVW